MLDHDHVFPEIIKTLEIKDVILTRSEHKVHSLYLEDQSLHINISHHADNNISVKDKFIIFEISLNVIVYESKQESENILLETNADFAAIYTYENVERFSECIEEFAVEFFRFSATTHLMAFARKYFYDVITDSGYPRLFIPLKSMLDDDASQAASEHLKEKANSCPDN